ncbi:DUF2273 domain-containing protein [Streptococcus sanguinis]|uniref:DUF2273 domain-containing protein n=1 Tax=Streptococcus sanguinis TaxID=1305 RepID=A0A7Y0YRL0_STRSA|nr:DUF2273 domain-containing protein [Streptococcus sanguinis]
MEWFKKYQYPILSGLAGIILACFILSFGFFKTLFVLICATLGQESDIIFKKYIFK